VNHDKLTIGELMLLFDAYVVRVPKIAIKRRRRQRTLH